MSLLRLAINVRRLTLLFSAFIAVNSFATGPLQSKRYFQNNGGLIDHISPLLVPENKASAIVNYMLDDRGQLTARSGWTLNNSTGALSNATSVVTGGGYHNAASGNNFFAVIVGTNVYRTSNSFGGTYNLITGTVTITANRTNLAQHTSLNDRLVFCNESDQPFSVGATGNAVMLGGSSPTGMKTCATYGAYLIGANTTESSVNYPSRIRWSDLNNPDSWPVLNFVDIEPNDGDKIVSMVTFKDSVYVFKKRSIYRLMITGLDGPDAFIVRPFSRNIGCWAKNSVRIIPNLGIGFLAEHTAYVLGDNELSAYNYSQLEAIGDPVQRSFDAVQHNEWANAVAAVYSQRYQYIIALSTASTTNRQLLVYDYIQKAWTTYSGLSVDMLEEAENSVGQAILLSGDYTGNVYKFDENSTQDTLSGSNNAISTQYTTGWLYQDSQEFTKNYKYLYLYTQNSSTATLNVSAVFDYGNNYEYSQTVGLGTATALYDTAIYDVDTYAQSGYVVNRFEINRSARAIKLNFTGSTKATSTNIVGWVLVYANEDYRE